jgi:non-lysosomal glucosylceramidase
VKVTAGVRDRYDGERRNPWNEIECGSNYARSMASWGAIVVLAGFSYDAVRGHIGFAPLLHENGTFRSFWSGANGYGTVEITDGALKLELIGGDLTLESLGLPAGSGAASKAEVNGKSVTFEAGPDEVRLGGRRLLAGDVLVVAAPALGLLDLPELARLQ